MKKYHTFRIPVDLGDSRAVDFTLVDSMPGNEVIEESFTNWLIELGLTGVEILIKTEDEA